jgi:hypothetical protein
VIHKPKKNRTPIQFVLKKTANGSEASTVILHAADGSSKARNAQSILNALQAITQVADPELAKNLLESAASAIEPLMREDQVALNVIAQAIHDGSPQDAAETRLITQAQAVWQHGMKALQCAGNATTMDHATQCANLAVKLLRLHNETVEALDRHRNKGEQRVQVTYLNADKAIVNNFQGGGGGQPNFKGENTCSDCVAPGAEVKARGQTNNAIGHANNPPWPMAGAGYTEGNVPVQKPRMAYSG